MPQPRRAVPPAVLHRHEVPIADLDPRLDGVRIAHLSDVHVGRVTPRQHIRDAVALANSVDPDVIVMTGDYVNWKRSEIALMEDQLAGLRSRHIAVTLGNHDYFASGRGVSKAFGRMSYGVLRNQHTQVRVNGARLNLVGVDDPVTRHHDIDQSFAGVDTRHTTVALCHCPEKADRIAKRGAHLILSGHTHGGQIYVKGLTDRVIKGMGRRYRSGFYDVGRAKLYVSAGVGFTGVRVRVGHGTRAEVPVYTLRRAAG